MDERPREIGQICLIGMTRTAKRTIVCGRQELDDPTWVPEVASSHLLVGTITTIAAHVDCALGRAWRMPMFHPQLMAATAMLEKLQKYFNALNEAVLGKRLGTAPYSMIAGHLAPELRTIPTREQMPDTLAQSAAEIMLSHVSALSHSGSPADRKDHMAGGVAVPLQDRLGKAFRMSTTRCRVRKGRRRDAS